MANWPPFLRLVFQRLRLDLVGRAPDFRQTSEPRVDELLSRMAQFAVLFALEETAVLPSGAGRAT